MMVCNTFKIQAIISIFFKILQTGIILLAYLPFLPFLKEFSKHLIS